MVGIQISFGIVHQPLSAGTPLSNSSYVPLLLLHYYLFLLLFYILYFLLFIYIIYYVLSVLPLSVQVGSSYHLLSYCIYMILYYKQYTILSLKAAF